MGILQPETCAARRIIQKKRFETLMTIFNLITLFGGLALFLYGMRLMGDGLKKVRPMPSSARWKR